MIAQAFVSEGKLRPLWRAVIYFCLGTYGLFPLLTMATIPLANALHIPNSLNAGAVAFSEIQNFIVALVLTAVFAAYEGRRIDSYGLPVDRALGRNTWEGMAAGVAMAGAVALGMMAFGGMKINGLATTGMPLLLSAIGWLLANVCVGVAEEFWYRSYFLQTLWKALGFWPGATLVALAFASDHYFYKAGENIWDVITLVSLSLLMSYSVLRSGTLWFAVGFHIAFDYMQLFVIGTPNGSLIPVGRLLDVTFQGPAWLTGGVLGTEASFLMYPAIALLWIYVQKRYRGNLQLE
jgi:CAAX protease family protein